MAAPINVLAFTGQLYHWETKYLKQLKISLYILPNSTISLEVLRNFLNVNNLKQLKFKIFFSGQPSALKREVTQPSFTKKFYENSPFVKQKYILR